MKKRHKKKESAAQDQLQAQERLEMILKVRSGQITATEAAKKMGISRKTYYEWEEKGLQGMLEGLTNRPGGRPAKSVDSEKEKLRRKIETLEKELSLTAGMLHIKKIMQEDMSIWQEVKKKTMNLK